jgi:hypothetical protein
LLYVIPIINTDCCGNGKVLDNVSDLRLIAAKLKKN